MADNPYAKYVTQDNNENPYAKYASGSVTNPPATSQITSSEPPMPEWAAKSPNLYGLYGAGRELYRTVGKPAIETAGMVGGGIIGAGSGFLAGVGLGAIPGAAAGAGLGYAGARNITGALDSAFELERGLQKPTMGQVVKENVKDVALGSIGAGTPAKSMLQNELAVARRIGGHPVTDAMLKETGVGLTSGEQTGGKTLAQAESLLEQIPFASDVMQNWREANQLKKLMDQRNKYLASGQKSPQGEELGKQIKDAIDKRLGQFDVAKIDASNKLRDDVLKKLGSKESYEALSKEGQGILASKSEVARDNISDLYRELGELIPNGKFETPEMAKVAGEWNKRKVKLPNTDKGLISELSWANKKEPMTEEQKMLHDSMKSQGYTAEIIDKMLEQSGYKGGLFKRDWQTLQDYRAQLNKLIKTEDMSIKSGNPALKGQTTPEGAIYAQMKKALDKDLESIAKKEGGDFYEKFKAVNAIYSTEYAPVWKNKIIRSMAYKNPDQVIDVAIKKGSTTEVDLIRKAMGNIEFDKTIKPAFTNKILGAGKDAPFDPKALQRNIAAYGDETLSKVYSKSELTTLKDLAVNGKLMLDKELPNTSLLKSIANKTDNVIVDSILGATERGAGSTKILQNVTALDPYLTKAQKEGLKTELMARVFKTSEITGQVEPVTMAKNISKYRDILKKYFNDQELSGLQKISAIGKQMGKAQQMAANPSGTAKNVIAWSLLNQVVFNPVEPLLSGDVVGSGKRLAMGLATAVLAPKMLAKIYLNPKMQQLLIKGMVTPNNTQQGKDIAKQLAIVIGNEQMNDEQKE
jgi:hypothetical protein